MKNILFAASECVPFIKTGGLADVVGSLPKDFDKEKYDVRVVIPNYMCMKQEWKEKLEYVAHFYMDIAGQDRYVGVLKIELNGIIFYFIDNEYYFSGFAPYDGDPKWNIEKFAFFSKAVLSILPVIGFRPELIHCHHSFNSAIVFSQISEIPGGMGYEICSRNYRTSGILFRSG